jgi:hypothetical protein
LEPSGDHRLVTPVLKRYSNPLPTRRQPSLGEYNDIHTNATDGADDTLVKAQKPTHEDSELLATASPQWTQAKEKRHSATLWKRLTHRRSTSIAQSENSEPKSPTSPMSPTFPTSQESPKSTKSPSSKLKSAFTRMKRKPKPAGVIVPPHKREDGDSTELEDSSDVESFYSTTSLGGGNPPEMSEPAATTIAVTTHGKDEVDHLANDDHAISSSSSNRAMVPYISGLSDSTKRPNTNTRPDKLKGAHLKTRFHEEI